MTLLVSSILLSVLAIIYTIYRRYNRISIADIPGPEADSYILGNLGEFYQREAGETNFKWEAQYGEVVRFKGIFGEDRLLVSDPKALYYIIQTSGYNFPKQTEHRELLRLVAGKGILWAAGSDHKRHRKVMLPGFSSPSAKAFVPIFSGYASKLGALWKDIIVSTSDQSACFNIISWASRATLDSIGEAAFDYQFGAIENADNKLRVAYSKLMMGTFGSLSKAQIFSRAISQYIPAFIRELLADYLPSHKLSFARNIHTVATDVARSLVTSKSEALFDGKGNRDILSLLVKANASEDKQTQLKEEEMLAQMRTILLAGHETTANSLSWTLLELSRKPEMQSKLRDEIRMMEKVIQARGDTEFTAADFDKMLYLSAVVKESLRYHPAVNNLFRLAAKDDVLPLSTPMATISGDIINEIPIPRGQYVAISIGGYNRNKGIFGEDAHVFNPERWFKPEVKKLTTVGVYGNLMTFSGGVRTCIGWRFAVLELQAFLVALVGDFEFSLTPEDPKIRREACLVTTPTIEGRVEEGPQLPLRVRIAPREG